MDDWQRVEGLAREYGGHAVAVVLVLLAGVLGDRFLVVPVRRLLERSRLDPSVASFLASSARTLLLAAVLLAVLQQVGVQTASLLTLLGAAGLAVALSLQGSLANFASGLLVLSFRMVRVGDQIEVGDARGTVREMNPFHVVLDTADNQRITLPNTLLTSGPVRNNSALPTRRVQWALPLPAGADLETAKEGLRTALLGDPRVHQAPAPEVYVQEWQEQKRTLAVTAWTATADAAAVHQELLEELGQALERVLSRDRTTPHGGAPAGAPPRGPGATGE
jgi:small conductance mechanosensitive channel